MECVFRRQGMPACAEGHLETGQELWVGSARLSTGVADDVTADEIQQFLSLRPPSTVASVLLADFNTHLRWTNAAGPLGQPMPTTGRADYLLNELGKQGYSLHAPASMQWDTPTSRPRRRNARGRQIDGVATKQTRRPDLSIDEGSFRQIGGDHDRLQVVVPSSGAHAKTEGWETRRRVVTGVIPPQPGLNQTRVEQLAASHTAPRKGNRYRDPHAVKQAFKQARREDSEEAWKRAQARRRRARDEWHQAKVVRAGQAGWQDLRDLRDRSGTEWAVYLTEEAYKRRKDPLTWTAQHFQKLFREMVVHEPARWSRFRGEGAPFTLEELRRVVSRGKTKKAVGLDLTSYELVKALCQDEVSEGSLLAWMESVRKGAEGVADHHYHAPAEEATTREPLRYAPHQPGIGAGQGLRRPTPAEDQSGTAAERPGAVRPGRQADSRLPVQCFQDLCCGD